MNARAHFSEAQKLILQKRGLVGILYLINLLFGIALTLPMQANFEALASTALAQQMLDGFFLDYFPDYWQQYAPAFSTALRYIGSFALFYMLLNIFLTGGIFTILANEPAFGFREFLYGSASYFGRYFRLFLLSLPWLALFAVLYGVAIFAPLMDAADSMRPDRANWLQIIALGLGLLVFHFWSLLLDYGKIALFTRDQKSAFKSFFKGVAFVAKNFLKSCRLYLLNLGIVCLLFVLYLGVESLIPNNTLPQTFALLLLQQVFVIARLWMKISFFASQYHFYTYVPQPQTSKLRELFTSTCFK